mgnify:CR=1 FL=1
MVRDASWLAHRYDPGRDTVILRRVPRAAYDTATFLTDDHLPASEELAIPRTALQQHAPAPARQHFIFHSAYCCSTLLARALDRPGHTLALKEPVILNDMVGWRRRGEPGPDQAIVLRDILALLARPFDPAEAVILKPSTVANGIAAAMMTLRSDASALLLHAPLRTYLASIASKGLDGRLWVRTMLLGMLDDRIVDLGFSPRDYIGQSDLQVAAVGWLAHQKVFADLVARFGPARVRTLDSEALLEAPQTALTRLNELFSLGLDQSVIEAIAGGDIFRRHAKFDTAFDSDARRALHEGAARHHADEIEKVAIWTEAVAQAAGIRLSLDAPLLG